MTLNFSRSIGTGLLGIAFMHIICVQLYKAMGVYHSIMDHSIGGVPQGVFEGQFIL
jgi:hypothetical protein